jgi:hypothetical protein
VLVAFGVAGTGPRSRSINQRHAPAGFPGIVLIMDYRRWFVKRSKAEILIIGLLSLILMISAASLQISRASVSYATGDYIPPVSANFSYGFDFAQQGPYLRQASEARAISSARRVMASIPGMIEDTSIMDWGLPNPEPTPGTFDLSALAARIRLISSTGGIPMITLCAAPEWMTHSTSPDVAPTASHYQDFARLAARIAQAFPQVRYFVVWNELKGFWDVAANTWNIQQYTIMYNDVYKAIKRVRPDAIVGGPYVSMTPYPTPLYGTLPSTPHGAWGYLDQRDLNAISYWLAHSSGAQFIAVDGEDFPQTGPIAGPLTATETYSTVDHWLRRRTSLPIWWIESPIQPADSNWPQGLAAAIRVAALVQAACSDAHVMLQWQPEGGEGIPDEGLWTATNNANGGKATVLAHLLPGVLSALRYPMTILPGQDRGVLVAGGSGGVIAINTTTGTARAVISGRQITLLAGQVTVMPRS